MNSSLEKTRWQAEGVTPPSLFGILVLRRSNTRRADALPLTTDCGESKMAYDRYWLLTWTTYGQWLPGDPRGSVTRLRESGFSHRVEHDQPQTPIVAPIPGLHASAEKRLQCPPVRLLQEHADILIGQFEQTAAYRSWGLKAVAIMANHLHLVVGVIGDPEPETLLRDFKSYGSRALNRQWPTPASGPGGPPRARVASWLMKPQFAPRSSTCDPRSTLSSSVSTRRAAGREPSESLNGTTSDGKTRRAARRGECFTCDLIPNSYVYEETSCAFVAVPKLA